jgi:hypothetical protein
MRRLARLIHGLGPQPIPPLPSDPWRDCTRHRSAEAKRVSARPQVSQIGAMAAVSWVNATRRQPRRLASAQRTVRVVREHRLLRQAR